MVERADDSSRSPSLVDHVGQGETRQVLLHVIANVRPDREEDALALVIARPVLVRLAEIARHNWSVDRRDHFSERDRPGGSCEHVPAADATLGPYESGALEGEENLFEVRLGKTRPFGDIAHRGGRLLLVQRETEKCPAGIVTSRGNPHALSVLREGHDSGGWCCH